LGLILDSSVLIAAERRRQSLSDLLISTAESTGFGNIVLSAVGVIEPEHGYWRANTPELAARRRAWLDEILTALPSEPFTKEMARLAAKIDAEARQAGNTIAFADLQIGVTALHFGFAVGTANVKHFAMIPGLAIKPL
jgi:predicted nucleic acid-binding protein